MDDASPISHVSDTAFWVATYRAVESERSDALFHDPLAARLVEGRGRDIAARMKDARTTAWSISVRTRIIDDLVTRALGLGIDAVLNLGAGLDTRPYRLDLPPELRWVEVDFPSIVELKEERLRGERPRCSLRRVSADLSVASERRALLADVARDARRILVLTEGVVPYLSLDDAAALARDLAERPEISRWIVDRFSREALRHRRRSAHARQLRNAPVRFEPADWEAFFATHGWRVEEIRYLVLEARRMGRRAPIGPFRRLLVALLPASRRRVLERLVGYAMLERAPPAPAQG